MTLPIGDQLKEKIIKLGLNRGTFLGCSPDEIERLRLAQRVERLPDVYRQFLMVMGHFGFEGVIVGSEGTYRDLLDLKDLAYGILEDDRGSGIEIPTLPSDAFVFFMHQGYEFRFFHTNNEEDNPAVWQYDQEPNFRKVSESLTEHFEQLIEVAHLLKEEIKRKRMARENRGGSHD